MALLPSPKEIHAVLSNGAPKTQVANSDLKSLLADAGLSAPEILDNLGSQMRTAEAPATRLRAAEIGLKLNGLLNSDENRPDFVVNILIQDSEFSSLNPILIPR